MKRTELQYLTIGCPYVGSTTPKYARQVPFIRTAVLEKRKEKKLIVIRSIREEKWVGEVTTKENGSKEKKKIQRKLPRLNTVGSVNLLGQIIWIWWARNRRRAS